MPDGFGIFEKRFGFGDFRPEFCGGLNGSEANRNMADGVHVRRDALA